MKKLLLFVSIFFVPALHAQELQVSEMHAPESVPFAQPFNVQYHLSHTPGQAVTVDEDSLSNDFEIQQMTSSDDSPGTTSYDFTVLPFVLGKSTFTVSFALQDAGKTVATTAADPAYIEITPVETFKDKKLREIRPPFIPAGWGTWLLVLLALAVLIYILRLWRKHAQQKHELRLRQLDDRRPSHVIALSKIEALVQSGLWENKQYKLFYITLIDILREYLQRRFALDVSADTSAELLYRLKTRQNLQPFLPLLRELLAQSDLVKFARVIPQEAQRNEHVRWLREFVDQTTPKPTPETEVKK